MIQWWVSKIPNFLKARSGSSAAVAVWTTETFLSCYSAAEIARGGWHHNYIIPKITSSWDKLCHLTSDNWAPLSGANSVSRSCNFTVNHNRIFPLKLHTAMDKNDQQRQLMLSLLNGFSLVIIFEQKMQFCVGCCSIRSMKDIHAHRVRPKISFPVNMVTTW